MKNNTQKEILKQHFINKSNLIHSGKYDYSNVVYLNNKTKVEIVCKIHGSFFQRPDMHIHQKQNCPACMLEYVSQHNKSRIISINEFLNRARKIHGDKYNYNDIIYMGMCKNINIRCNMCGKVFNQEPLSHCKGIGCPFCAVKLQSNTSEFISNANAIHDSKYDYTLVEYKKSRIKVKIKCKKCKTIFNQRPNDHLQGRGCPKCTHIISNPESLFLEYLKIPNSVNNRQVRIINKKVDGIIGDTIYEFLGDYWHGNPNKYDSHLMNSRCKKTFKELYDATLNRFRCLTMEGYVVKYVWETDWKLFQKKKIDNLKIKTFNGIIL